MGRRAAKVAEKKAKGEAAKSKIYSRYGKKIAGAIKTGGSDPLNNMELASLIKEAKAAGVPKDNIDRLLKKADDAPDYTEVIYEVYGHGGVGMLVTCLTDNTNRAASVVKAAVKKAGGKDASPGSVSFQFTKMAKIEIPEDRAADLDEDKVFEIALESSVDDIDIRPAPLRPDIENNEDGSTPVPPKWVLTTPNSLKALRDALEANGIEGSTSLAHIPNALVDCSEEELEKNLGLIDALEDIDDVDMVEHNISFA
ncbi:unnamed protein product [Vitrella brassicaformis CCMP3155]|uniref:Transcriptional regulatory protein n=1 Tax=Vitrella brassicaformis (strain CCMP3155) TaxID=1169540 RepID=A0A0G4EJ73_VITBC|nr:unnamed protein product [Vitrella brassicaformis CCMP3155]|eukprot:CEL95960.1 unnamed protein product [Vitrella brassicaformis CCMP3155]